MSGKQESNGYSTFSNDRPFMSAPAAGVKAGDTPRKPEQPTPRKIAVAFVLSLVVLALVLLVTSLW